MISQATAARSSRRSFLTIAQLVVSLGGALASLTGIGFVFIADRYLQVQTGISRTSGMQSNLLIWLLLLLGISSLPSIVLSIRWLKGIEPKQIDSNRWMTVANLLLVLWAGALISGQFLQRNGSQAALLIGVNLFVIALPLAWLLGFSLRKIKTGTWKRFWGAATGTFFLTLPLIILVEGVILVGAVLAISAYASTVPGLQNVLSKLSQLSTASPDQIDALINQITPVITTPGALYALLFAFGLLIPLVEELFKPLMVWIFARRNLTPGQGFALGLISGASFALIESLFAISAAGGTDYLSIALGRTGTGLLHTFNTGMMGWALASTWRDGKELRLALTYGGAALLHGTWNSLAIVMGFGSLPLKLQTGFSSIAASSPWILGLLAVWMLTILFVMNRKLADEENRPLTSDSTSSED